MPALLTAAGIGYREHDKAWAHVYELDRCLSSDDHNDGAAIYQFPNGAVAYKCFHNRCAGVTWHDVKPRLGIPVQQTGYGAASSEDDESGDETEAMEDEARSKGKSQTTKLVALALEGDTDLFYDEAGKSYITFPNDAHQETWSLTSTPLRDWLSARYYATYNTAPGSQALKDALNTLSGIARFEGKCRPVYVRLAGHDGDIYLDLGNQAWEVVKITVAGWEVIPAVDAPIRFRRPAGLLPLPYPVLGGTLAAFRKLVNVKDEANFTLILGWLLGALRPDGPYTILGLAGEQGTAKTTLGRMLRGAHRSEHAPSAGRAKGRR